MGAAIPRPLGRAAARPQASRRREIVMTTTAAWTHRHTCTLPASPARVFAALTTRQELCRWFAEDVAVDLRDGGAFAFWGRYTYGVPSAADARQRITQVEPDRLLAFRWPFDGVDSEVT